MADSVPPPILETLLPPLLAHLPASFTSPHPPPSLYPLLAPILRNRVRLLLDSTPTSWLALLTWSSTHATALVNHLKDLDLHPHPISGELESGPTILNGIQRADQETLKASVSLPDWGLEVIYTWCTNDPDGEDDAWRILDLHALSNAAEGPWHPTVLAADQAFSAPKTAARPAAALSHAHLAVEEEDDDDYWNMYDRSSAATPAARELDNPPSEEAYFSQYDEAMPSMDDSIYSENSYRDSCATAASTPPLVTSAPRPLSPNSKLVVSLEAAADHSAQTEVAVKQHISTSLKSLYRLSKAAGISRYDFEALVSTEMSVLSMMDEGEE